MILLFKLAIRNIFRNVSRTALTVFLISTSLIALVFMVFQMLWHRP